MSDRLASRERSRHQRPRHLSPGSMFAYSCQSADGGRRLRKARARWRRFAWKRQFSDVVNATCSLNNEQVRRSGADRQGRARRSRDRLSPAHRLLNQVTPRTSHHPTTRRHLRRPSVPTPSHHEALDTERSRYRRALATGGSSSPADSLPSRVRACVARASRQAEVLTSHAPWPLLSSLCVDLAKWRPSTLGGCGW